MKIITTAILLGITLLVVTVFSFYFGFALGAAEWQAFHTLIIIMVIVAAYSFIVGELTGNYQRGFLNNGLWTYSRHPNYFADQSIWVCFYLFSVTASGQWFNWSIAGCLLLMVLFQDSSTFSVEISKSKYPEYKEYQKSVSRFFPF